MGVSGPARAGAAADRLLRRIAGALNMLSEVPDAGIARPELRQGVRCFPIERYVIFYEHTEDALIFVRIIHAARDIAAELFDE